MAVLSSQAILLSVVLGVLTLVAAVATFLNYTEETLIGLILWVAIFAIVIYDTECLATGNCGTWSWIRMVLWSIIPVFVIVVLIMAMVRNKKRMEASSRKIIQDAEATASRKLQSMTKQSGGDNAIEDDDA
jgi:uncharacterized membrane protein